MLESFEFDVTRSTEKIITHILTFSPNNKSKRFITFISNEYRLKSDWHLIFFIDAIG